MLFIETLNLIIFLSKNKIMENYCIKLVILDLLLKNKLMIKLLEHPYLCLQNYSDKKVMDLK